MINTCSDALPFEKHDHDQCLKETIESVEDYCKSNDLRLTPVRRKVLEFLLQEHKALGAYDLSLIHI